MQKTHTNTNIKHPLKPPLILQIFVVFCKTLFLCSKAKNKTRCLCLDYNHKIHEGKNREYKNNSGLWLLKLFAFGVCGKWYEMQSTSERSRISEKSKISYYWIQK